ncbi:MAG: hypothetical protein GY928_24220 [Colwellia sp.]|nr:hypothetical protein [Colwellia sp.]
MFNTPHSKEPTSMLSRIKSISFFVQSGLTIGAIIVAGIWFFVQREASLKANIDQKVTHRQIDKDWTWVHVSVSISNQGKRFLDLKSGTIRIQKIMPLAKEIADKIANNQDPISSISHKVPWPNLCDPYEPVLEVGIMPGEIDQINCEFIIPSYVQSVKIYSFFKKDQKQRKGLTKTTIYDIIPQSVTHR